MRKKILLVVIATIILMVGVGCNNQARRVSYNLSKEADSFNVVRQLTVISLFTNDVLFQMTGRLSIETIGSRLEIVVEHDRNLYKKHFVHLGDNLTYVVEDLGLGANDVSSHKYTLRYNPKMWIPIEIESID